MRDIEKEIREHWFHNHKATLTEHGDLQVLQWKQEGTVVYSCRYVFDKNKLYISGDIGHAVFDLTWKASIHSFNDIHIGYFAEKLAAYQGEIRGYNGENAVKELKEWQERLDEDEVIYEKSEFRDMIRAAESCSTINEWAYECVNDRFHDLIRELDNDYWEWIYDIGNEMPARIHGYLIGLKMASEQLRKEALNEQLQTN